MPELIPAKPGTIPPVGYMLGQVRQEETGEDLGLFWIDPKSIQLQTEIQTPLTDEQKKEAKAIFSILAEVDGHTEERFLFNLACNQHPAWELTAFKRIAYAFQAELPYRSGIAELNLLYLVLLNLSFLPDELRTIGNLLSACPRAKSLKNLERVFNRFNA